MNKAALSRSSFLKNCRLCNIATVRQHGFRTRQTIYQL